MVLKGKNALVTGSARGIGKAIAEKFSSEGVNIAIVDIDEETSLETRNQLLEKGVKVESYIQDLRDIEQYPKLYDEIIKEFGNIDIVVNAAGIIKINRFLEVQSEHWDDVMNLNAKSLFFSMQEAAKRMIAAGRGGRIINVSSITSKSSRPDYPVYAASKAAINSVTRSAASALAKHNITVNAVCPGYVHTDMWEQMDRHYVEKLNRPKGEVIERLLKKYLITFQWEDLGN